jgi:molybdate transport system ATP-binding protein
MDLKADFTKTFPGGLTIRATLALPLEASGLTVLFGPSGCGKTTVLRCLAGLERPDTGTIMAGEACWFSTGGGHRLPGHQRRIGYVFQESALFPHLGVAGNIAYGLQGWSRADRRQRVEELMEVMGLGALDARRVPDLSGGEQQRVALARALAPRPRLVLLDEPFASLDRLAAEQLRACLRQILHTLEVPAILVTHHPEEALALGDRMLRMAGGRIVQEGTPAEVLSRSGVEAEGQMGAVVRTRVLGKVEGLLHLAAGAVELFAPDPGVPCAEAFACIRGEGVSLERGPHGVMTQRNRIPATITGLEAQGALTRVRLDAGFPFEALITTWACGDLRFEVGERITALVKASAIRVIPIKA